MSEGEKNEQNPKRLALIPRVTASVLPGNAARTECLRKVETPPFLCYVGDRAGSGDPECQLKNTGIPGKSLA